MQLADKSWPLTDHRNIIAWRSVKDRMKHGSSTSGEVNALQQALEDTDEHILLISAFLRDIPIRILSDSMSGILQVINGGHTIRDRERAAYIRTLLECLPIPFDGLEHVSGLIQMADPLTKIKILDWFNQVASLF